jgi:predicted regulator of amino acid metabolism with ACT domain
MTIEEAIERLKNAIEINERSIKQIKEIGKNAKTLSKIFTEAEQAFLNENMACEIGIQALEKQVPKKVVNFMLNDGKLIKVFKGICPYCQCIVTNEYCSRCGQALDWSDSDA